VLVEYAQRRAAAEYPGNHGALGCASVAGQRVVHRGVRRRVIYQHDLFLARLADWGISASNYAGEVGGATPHLPWRPLKMLRSLPLFLRMQRIARGHLLTLGHGLQRFDQELTELVAQRADGQQLADWFTRFYVFVVQGNLCIATALASSGGEWLGRPPTAYDNLENSPHRLPWETDPATPRPAASELPLQAFPQWSSLIRIAHSTGLPACAVTTCKCASGIATT